MTSVSELMESMEYGPSVEDGAAVRDWLASFDEWTIRGLVPSPIDGGDGNREFLLGARKR